MEKSANKLWKESGTTLSFKEWISRENQKKEEPKTNFIPFIGEDVLNRTLSGTPTSVTPSGVEGNTKTVLGLNKGVLIFSSLIIVVSLSFYFYRKLKNRK